MYLAKAPLFVVCHTVVLRPDTQIRSLQTDTHTFTGLLLDSQRGIWYCLKRQLNVLFKLHYLQAISKDV